MNLYLFDYAGTLNTVLDPVGLLLRIRRRDPGCVIAVMSGGEVPDCVKEVADHFWEKGRVDINVAAQMLDPDLIVLSEDAPLLRRALERSLSQLCPVASVPPEDLEGLRTGENG